MKVSVNVQINYDYSVDIPEEWDGERVESTDDIIFLADCDDPVYSDLCKILHRAGLNYIGNTVSVINEETEEVIWAE